eukprot:gene16750-18444_t
MEDEFNLPVSRRETTAGTIGPRMWTSEETDRLIEHWSKHELLYNPRHPDYYKRDKRALAMNDICLAMGVISAGDITRKMENLRSYYGREKRKMSDTAGGDFNSRWAYFQPLSFLQDHMNQKQRIPRLDLSEHDTQDVGVENAVNNLNKSEEIESESQELLTPNKKQKTNDKGRLDATIARLQKPNDNSTSKAATSLIQPSRDNHSFTTDLNDLHADMVFAEHVGRTIMTITDELLKEDLKLQIQQCLCTTKRKQLAILQQQEQLQRRMSQNNPPFLASFSLEGDTKSPLNSDGVQVLPDVSGEQNSH